MINVRPPAEDEVVLAFLRGELDSPRFGAEVRAALERAGGVELATNPNLRSRPENDARRAALATTRGWRSNQGQFAGFPDDLTWQHARLEPADLDRVRYVDYSYWNELSALTRLPSAVHQTILNGDLPQWILDIGTDWFFELADDIANRPELSGLIILATTDLQNLVLLEGHARTTALFLGDLQHTIAVTAYIGTSPNVRQWAMF